MGTGCTLCLQQVGVETLWSVATAGHFGVLQSGSGPTGVLASVVLGLAFVYVVSR